MGSITDYLENELLDHVFNAAFTSPTNIYLALCTADPTDAATGAAMNECADSGSYARTAISFGLAAARAVTQDADVTFPTATGSWGTVTHWAITDGNTHGAGNVLAHGAFGASKLVSTDDTPSVASGEINVTFTGSTGISNYLANELLDHCFNNAAFTTTASSTYIGLWTATLDDTSTGATAGEPAGGSYAREEVSENGGTSPTWSLAASGAVTTLAAVTFTTATASWGTISYMGITDSLTTGAGNMLFYANVTDKAVGDGDTAEFATGDIDVTMT